jgi:alpha-glucoside transport system substrate-binding protein
MRSRSWGATGASLGAVALLTTGCLGDAAEGRAGPAGGSDTIELMYPVADDLGEEFQEEVRFWARSNGVEVEFSPTASINELIATRVQGNDPPDVALFSQPARVRELAERDLLLDLSAAVAQADRDAMLPDLLAAGQVDDGLFAVPVSVHVDSLVFYPSVAREQAGLIRPPATMADLRSLTDRLAETGMTPWCFGVESDEEAGRAAADWVENLMLINYGSGTYHQWVEHEIPFDDPRVAAVLEEMATLLLEEGMTSGGRESIAGTDAADADEAMFTDPPGCHLYLQSDLGADGGFPEEVVEHIDRTVGVFPLPGLTAASKPVLGAGHLAGVLNQDSAPARDLVRFLASPKFGTNGYAQSGTWTSPRRDFDRTLYPTDTWRTVAAIVHTSTEFALDGSEQMPPEVGSGAFPGQMTAWISGEQDTETTLENIEASWPEE